MSPFKTSKNTALLVASVFGVACLLSTGFASWAFIDSGSKSGDGDMSAGADYVFIANPEGIDIVLNNSLPSFGTYFFQTDEGSEKEANLKYSFTLTRSKMPEALVDAGSFSLRCEFGLYTQSLGYVGTAKDIVSDCSFAGNATTATYQGSSGTVELPFTIPESQSETTLSFTITHQIILQAHQAISEHSGLSLKDFTFRLSFGFGGNPS